MATLKAGDLAALISGSPRMAVESVDGDSVSLVWCNEGVIHRDTFDKILLKRWEVREGGDERGGKRFGGGSLLTALRLQQPEDHSLLTSVLVLVGHVQRTDKVIQRPILNMKSVNAIQSRARPRPTFQDQQEPVRRRAFALRNGI